MFLVGRSFLSRSAIRYTLILCILVIFVLVASGIVLNWTLQAQVKAEVDEMLVDTYDEFIRADVTTDELVSWFFQLAEEDGFFNFAYQDQFGNIIGGVSPEIFTQDGFATVISDELFDPSFVRNFTVLFAQEDIIDEDKWRIFVGDLDGGRIVIFEPVENVEDALALFAIFLTYVGLALIVVTMTAGGVLAFQQQKRIDQIEARLARVGRGDLTNAKLPAVLRDDLDHIMAGIEDAAAQLDNSITQLRLFTQNAAHELNTPLARLRAQLEQLAESDQKDVALSEADTVIRTLAGVQRIARLSHRPSAESLSIVDLGEVAELMRDLYADVIEENGQQCDILILDSKPVLGDFQLLSQMASNLVENAIRHAGNNAIISIIIKDRQLIVGDTGKGLSDAAVVTAFKPFQRDASAGGSGLGLALVKAIADYHSAVLTTVQENGFSIHVTFPDPK